MNLDPIVAAAGVLEEFCGDRAWRCCFSIGLAVRRWGEPRFTADAGLTLVREETEPLLELREEPEWMTRFYRLQEKLQRPLG